ncbi:ubiquitin-conjugating enzyme E2 [Fadolivirus algeromassiliense]|jgi:ubiquitin-conjugating enzyme E2 C|uniref:E2 ubiquitin-conjugating enzyme n=1 Tax=Fadolivirus FV1/VV64 TaxID=3070911 RepID=A0A7D3QV40_9VIRU|nr:ubiquitin-conjugating enzyme E2 [Fadolivirus algeromassiliense]QKF94725.1 ubiquitin-conjugating enzyme E2 [Fadolivirus FV1/VV64]
MSTAIKQLQKDFLYLQKNPIVGANAQPFDDKDLFKWYGIIVGAEGSPFEGVPIRFVMEFPQDYPNSPPKAFFDTYIAYHGGASYYVEGRLSVCLNIFGNFGHVHTEWKNQSGGWSPSYSVATILITMQGLMMSFSYNKENKSWHSEMLSTRKEDIERTINEAMKFKCKITGHDGSDSTKWFPQVLLSQDDLVEKMKSLGIDSKEQKYDLMKDFYICYVTKTSAREGAVLGYGVHVENQRNGALSSPCEYLSLDAFNSGTRNGSTNKPFEYWLPILIDSAMWPKTKPLFMKSIGEIGTGINYKKDPASTIVKVCSSIMNQLVVEVMNNKNNLTANDKFVNGYFALYRLMKQYAKDDPKIIQYVNHELQQFITNPNKRSKKDVPNLGELLIYLTISDKFIWNDVSKQFQEECDARNFFWYAVGNYNNPPKCPELLSPSVVNLRAEKVFDATPTSRNIVMFQVQFSRMASQLTLEVMDSNFGLAPEKVRDDIKGAYNKITGIKSWDEYFTWLEMPLVNSLDRSKQLVNAITISKKNGYHK